jgi:hypothetical protein
MKRARRAVDGLDDDIRDHIERETQDNLETRPAYWPSDHGEFHVE